MRIMKLITAVMQGVKKLRPTKTKLPAIFNEKPESVSSHYKKDDDVTELVMGTFATIFLAPLLLLPRNYGNNGTTYTNDKEETKKENTHTPCGYAEPAGALQDVINLDTLVYRSKADSLAFHDKYDKVWSEWRDVCIKANSVYVEGYYKADSIWSEACSESNRILSNARATNNQEIIDEAYERKEKIIDNAYKEKNRIIEKPHKVLQDAKGNLIKEHCSEVREWNPKI